MTTTDTFARAVQPPAQGRFRLPDIPQRDPDEVTRFDSLFRNGNSHHLAIHLGNPDTTLVEADRWIVPDASFNKRRARYPDLLVAFDVSPPIMRPATATSCRSRARRRTSCWRWRRRARRMRT